MRIREVYLRNQAAVNDADTLAITLQPGMKIQYFRIQFRAQNGATSNTLCKLNSSVSKLQVLDGSTVLHSLSMIEELAKNCFDYGRFPFQYLSENDDDVVIEEAVIDFRRFPGDVNFYLDTSQYSNPQLQLTWNMPISGTAGFVTATTKITVIAGIIDSGAPSRLGYVMAKEIASFASAASGDSPVDLPNDWPIAALLVTDAVDGEGVDNYLSNFKVTLDTDSYIPINSSYLDLLYKNHREYGLFEQLMRYLEDTSAVLKFDVYNNVRAHISISDSVGLPEIETIAGNEVTIGMTTGGDPNMSVAARGNAPGGAVIYKFGDGIDPTQILSPSDWKKAQLVLTNANTGATPKVVLVQQHP